MATLLQCKLCSTTNNLISLFSGKCFENRNYIRKLVAVTTGIKFTENGTFNYICFNCVVQIYNFHIFKIRAAENEGRLQSINSKSRRTCKYEIQSIDDIKLPNLDELKNTLGNWLLTKKQTLEDNSEQHESNHEGSLDLSTQKCAVEDCCNKTSFSRTIINTVNSNTQTDHLSKCNVKIQCDLRNTLKRENYTQTEFKTANNISTQTDNILKCNVKIQCDPKNKSKKGSYTQTESQTANSIAIQTESNTNNKCDCTNTIVTSELQQKCSVIDINKQKGNYGAKNKSQVTNNLNSSQLSYVQNIYINQKPIDSPNTKNEATTFSLNNMREISNLVSKRSLQHPSSKTNVINNCNKDIIPNISDKILSEEMFDLKHSPLDISPIKEELKSATPSPCSPLLASLKIIIDSEEDNRKAKTSSPDNTYVSLSSCNLLAIKKKVQPVYICKYCDHTLYSKAEIKLHKRIHLTCSFCKKAFSDVKKTGIHMDFECNQKIARLPVISMVRIEDSKEIQETLPQVCLELKDMINVRNIAKRNAAPVNLRFKKAKLK